MNGFNFNERLRKEGTMNGYNFTERVRKVLALSREEAARLHHEYVGTEHILLGLIREREGVAAAVLQSLKVDLDQIQRTIERVLDKGRPSQEAGPDLPYTSRAKKVLELSMSEARELNHSYVGTEHLLLGLLREEKGIAAQVLADANVTVEIARAETLRLLGADVPPAGRAGTGGARGEDWKTAFGAGGKSFEQLLSRSTPRLQAVLLDAVEAAFKAGRGAVEPEHLLEALLAERDGAAAAILGRLGVDRRVLHDWASNAARSLPVESALARPVSFSELAAGAMQAAAREARNPPVPLIGTEHLLIGLLLINETAAARILREGGVSLAAARDARDRLAG